MADAATGYLGVWMDQVLTALDVLLFNVEGIRTADFFYKTLKFLPSPPSPNELHPSTARWHQFDQTARK